MWHVSKILLNNTWGAIINKMSIFSSRLSLNCVKFLPWAKNQIPDPKIILEGHWEDLSNSFKSRLWKRGSQKNLNFAPVLFSPTFEVLAGNSKSLWRPPLTFEWGILRVLRNNWSVLDAGFDSEGLILNLVRINKCIG